MSHIKSTFRHEKAVRVLGATDQKRVRMNISNALLAQFGSNKSEFWRRLITVDETWIQHYTPDTFFVKWRGNHLREQLFCREKCRVLFGRVTEMGASLGEVYKETMLKIFLNFRKNVVSLLGRKLFWPPSYFVYPSIAFRNK